MATVDNASFGGHLHWVGGSQVDLWCAILDSDFHGMMEGGVGDGAGHRILVLQGVKVGGVMTSGTCRWIDKRARGERSRGLV